MKKIIIAVLTIIFLFLSFWFGESGKGLFQLWPYVIGLFGMMVLSYIVSKRWGYRIAYAFIFIVIYGFAFYMGNMSFSHAYNSCINEAEQIRTVLSNYKVKNGTYPKTLHDLNMPLPCTRILRGSIVEYKTEASNYKLSFKDWLVEHVATDKEPFMAHK